MARSRARKVKPQWNLDAEQIGLLEKYFDASIIKAFQALEGTNWNWRDEVDKQGIKTGAMVLRKPTEHSSAPFSLEETFKILKAVVANISEVQPPLDPSALYKFCDRCRRKLNLKPKLYLELIDLVSKQLVQSDRDQNFDEWLTDKRDPNYALKRAALVRASAEAIKAAASKPEEKREVGGDLESKVSEVDRQSQLREQEQRREQERMQEQERRREQAQMQEQEQLRDQELKQERLQAKWNLDSKQFDLIEKYFSSSRGPSIILAYQAFCSSNWKEETVKDEYGRKTKTGLKFLKKPNNDPNNPYPDPYFNRQEMLDILKAIVANINVGLESSLEFLSPQGLYHFCDTYRNALQIPDENYKPLIDIVSRQLVQSDIPTQSFNKWLPNKEDPNYKIKLESLKRARYEAIRAKASNPDNRDQLIRDIASNFSEMVTEEQEHKLNVSSRVEIAVRGLDIGTLHGGKRAAVLAMPESTITAETIEKQKGIIIDELVMTTQGQSNDELIKEVIAKVGIDAAWHIFMVHGEHVGKLAFFRNLLLSPDPAVTDSMKSKLISVLMAHLSDPHKEVIKVYKLEPSGPAKSDLAKIILSEVSDSGMQAWLLKPDQKELLTELIDELSEEQAYQLFVSEAGAGLRGQLLENAKHWHTLRWHLVRSDYAILNEVFGLDRDKIVEEINLSKIIFTVEELEALRPDAAAALFGNKFYGEANWEKFAPAMAKALTSRLNSAQVKEILKKPQKMSKLMYLFGGGFSKEVAAHIKEEQRTEVARRFLLELNREKYWHLREAPDPTHAAEIPFAEGGNVDAMLNVVGWSPALSNRDALSSLVKTALCDPNAQYDFVADPYGFKKNNLVFDGMMANWPDFVKNMNQSSFEYIFKDEDFLKQFLEKVPPDKRKVKLGQAFVAAADYNLLKVDELSKLVAKWREEGHPDLASMVLVESLPQFLRYTQNFDKASVKLILELIQQAKSDDNSKPFTKDDGISSNALDAMWKKVANYAFGRNLHPLLVGIYNNANDGKWKLMGPFYFSEDILTDSFLAWGKNYRYKGPAQTALEKAKQIAIMGAVFGVAEKITGRKFALPWEAAVKSSAVGSAVGTATMVTAAFVAKVVGISLGTAAVATGVVMSAGIGLVAGAVSGWMGFWAYKLAKKAYYHFTGTLKEGAENHMILKMAFQYGDKNAITNQILDKDKPARLSNFVSMVLALEELGHPTLSVLPPKLHALVKKECWEQMKTSSTLGKVIYGAAHTFGKLVGWPSKWGYLATWNEVMIGRKKELEGDFGLVEGMPQGGERVEAAMPQNEQGARPTESAQLASISKEEARHTLHGDYNQPRQQAEPQLDQKVDLQPAQDADQQPTQQAEPQSLRRRRSN